MLHLKVIAKADPERLADEKLIHRALTDLVRLVGMQPLGDPIINNVPLELEKLGQEPFADEGGVTTQMGSIKIDPCVQGFLTLTTSHCAIHTWPLRNEFHFDLYSCREYDGQTVLDFLTEVFHTTKIKATDHSEGCHWD